MDQRVKSAGREVLHSCCCCCWSHDDAAGKPTCNCLLLWQITKASTELCGRYGPSPANRTRKSLSFLLSLSPSLPLCTESAVNTLCGGGEHAACSLPLRKIGFYMKRGMFRHCHLFMVIWQSHRPQAIFLSRGACSRTHPKAEEREGKHTDC